MSGVFAPYLTRPRVFRPSWQKTKNTPCTGRSPTMRRARRTEYGFTPSNWAEPRESTEPFPGLFFIKNRPLFFYKSLNFLPLPLHHLAPLGNRTGKKFCNRIFVQRFIHHHPLIIRVERNLINFVTVSLVVSPNFPLPRSICGYRSKFLHSSVLQNVRMTLARGVSLCLTDLLSCRFITNPAMASLRM